ncbi:MAG: ATP-binding cassette domain-containing protein [Planctomycetes bacterium]|jgi:ABC-type branched-subunit amino acid transport system ATPase component|nr:ATP-binding cassette domain-containing protein [Planctomycetota bacterium]
MLELKDISFSIDGHAIVSGVNLSVSRGEIVGLIGPNGSGKTTLFNIINGFLKPNSGTVNLAGARVNGLKVEQRVAMGVGRLWQDVRVFPKMTSLENLLVSVKNSPGDKLWRTFVQPKKVGIADKEAVDRAEAFLHSVGLFEKRKIEAENLSSGQQKLVAIGRLFISEASILLLDEPYAGVSYVLFDLIDSLLQKMRGENRCIVIIEHNILLIQPIVQKMYALDRGRVVAEGKATDVISSSAVKEAYAGI